MSLAALIEKLEKATEGSRELDALIECEARKLQAYALGLSDKVRSHWNPVGSKGEVICTQGITRYHAPMYSTSIDAAMTLKPTDANCYGVDIYDDHAEAYFGRNRVKEGHWLIEAEAKTPALALCIAALKSRDVTP